MVEYGDAVTEPELEAAMADLREEVLLREDLPDIVSEMEESAQGAVIEEAPDVARKMRGEVDYCRQIGARFGTTASPPQPRAPAGGAAGAQGKLDADRDTPRPDYGQAITDAFSRD